MSARDLDSLRFSAVNTNWRLLSRPPNDSSCTMWRVIEVWSFAISGFMPRPSVLSPCASAVDRFTSNVMPRSIGDRPNTTAIWRTR